MAKPWLLQEGKPAVRRSFSNFPVLSLSFFKINVSFFSLGLMFRFEVLKWQYSAEGNDAEKRNPMKIVCGWEVEQSMRGFCSFMCSF